jgi:hypothetical protein
MPFGLYTSKYFNPGAARHLDIEHDNFRPVGRSECLQDLLAVRAAVDNSMAGAPQQSFEAFEHDRMVVGNQQSHAALRAG